MRKRLEEGFEEAGARLTDYDGGRICLMGEDVGEEFGGERWRKSGRVGGGSHPCFRNATCRQRIKVLLEVEAFRRS